jgi:hypothetical protein
LFHRPLGQSTDNNPANAQLTRQALYNHNNKQDRLVRSLTAKASMQQGDASRLEAGAATLGIVLPSHLLAEMTRPYTNMTPLQRFKAAPTTLFIQPSDSLPIASKGSQHVDNYNTLHHQAGNGPVGYEPAHDHPYSTLLSDEHITDSQGAHLSAVASHLGPSQSLTGQGNSLAGIGGWVEGYGSNSVAK